MHYEIHEINVEDEFKVCPTCGYRDGFHTMLKRIEGEKTSLFICPACHDIFNVIMGEGEERC